MKPKGNNCSYVIYDEALDTYRCTKCGTQDPDHCSNHALFEPKKPRNEVIQDFSADIKNPQIMLREYRDIAALLWTLGQFDEDEEESPVINVEKRVIPDELGSGNKPSL